MSILGLHHAQITIPLGAEEPARAFYCGLLGLHEIAKPGVLQGRGGFWLQAGAQQVHVGVEDGVERNRRKAHLGYLVDDLEELRARLTGAEVTVEEGPELPGLRRFEARDPFGNRIEFLQEVR